MKFILKQFPELSIQEFYDIYKLRNAVFVVEQKCPYQDIDDKDPKAYHLCMYSDDDVLVGYSRILAPGISYKQPSIGRVAVDKDFRGKGHGGKLMKYSLSKTMELFDGQNIVISAQDYLRDFYTQLGFKTEGEVYPEDGIPHIKMIHVVG